jgi:aminomethyltransferase
MVESGAGDLDTVLDAAGATWTQFQGSRAVERFGDPDSEHRAARGALGWAPAAWLALVELRGDDRLEWLQGLFTNDLAGLPVGGGCYGFHLTVKGRSISDLRVLRREESLLLLLPRVALEPLLEQLDRYLIREDVEIENLGQSWTVIGVHGPRGAIALGAATGRAIPDLPEHAFIEGTIAGAPVTAVRSDATGEVGHEILVARASAAAVWTALDAAGRAHGGAPVGLAAMRSLAIEAGTPWFGIDMDEGTIPIEAGLETRTISYTKGCYVGQEVIARIHSQGHVNRHLRGLYLSPGPLPAPGARLFVAEREVGRITSAVESPSLERPVALAYVRREHAAAGSLVLVESERERSERPSPAEVRELPLYRRSAS